MSCADYAPDPMAGGSDCRICGWPQEDHAPRITPEQQAAFDHYQTALQEYRRRQAEKRREGERA